MGLRRSVRELPFERLLLVGSVFLYGALCLIFLSTDALGIRVLVQYGQLLILAAVGSCLCRGAYFTRRRYLIGAMFALWHYVCFWLRGELSLPDQGRVEALRCILLCCVALPFAFLTGDSSRRLLDRLLTGLLTVVGALYLLAFAALLRGENITLVPVLAEFGATYTRTGRLMLKLLNVYHYCAGYLAVACFYASLYMAVRHRRKKQVVLWAVLMAVFAAGVLITYSRTAVFTMAAVAVYVLYLVLRRLGLRRWQRVALLLVCAAGVAVLTGLVMNRIYAAVRSVRDIWYGLATLSDRTRIWAGGWELIRAEPMTLLRGQSPLVLMDRVNSHITGLGTIEHMHSAFLQTLLRTGLPGMLLITVLAGIMARSALQLLTLPGARLEDKFLLCLPCACLLMGVVENLIFYCAVSTELLNLLTMLFCGYAFERAEELRAGGAKKE